MATYTDNYALVKPTYGELADVAVINGNMDTIDGIMHSNRTMLAPAFSQTEDYAEGDVVVYEGNLYRFIVPHTAGNWDGTEVEQTTLGEEVSTKGGADVTKEVSGNPVEFDDGASAPLVKCVTEIQGSQDLHGYDKPWVGGAGKNKLPLVLADIKSANTSGTWNGNAYTVHGVTFTVLTDNGGNVTGIKAENTADASTFFNLGTSTISAGDYILNGCPANGLDSTYFLYAQNTSGTYKDYGVGISISEASDISTQFTIAIRTGVTCNFTFYPMIRLSTVTDPTYEPYSNICPITAYTEGEIEVAENALLSPLTFIQGGIDGNDGHYYDDSARVRSSEFEVVGGEEYYFDYNDSTIEVFTIHFYNSSDEWISRITVATPKKYTTPANCKYVAYVFRKTNNSNITPSELSNEKLTTFKGAPYTHTTTYPSAIYRGSEDVVNGTETHDMVVIDLGSLSWTYSSQYNRFQATLTGYKKPSSNTVPFNAICSCYETVGANYTADSSYDSCIGANSGSDTLIVRDTRYTDATAFTSTVTGQTLAYELATPTTSSVTPTNLPIKSLNGYTHIESSTGDMEIEYITSDYQPLVDLIESSKHVYSTAEQIVGTWIDGSVVYEKTLYYEGGQSGAVTFAHGISNFGKLVSIEGNCYDNQEGKYMPFPRVGPDGNNIGIVSVDSTNVQYAVAGAFATRVVDVYLTIRYTKSTTPTRSLNLTKSAVTEEKDEIPDEIKNAPFEEKPETNEADDSAPTEVER